MLLTQNDGFILGPISKILGFLMDKIFELLNIHNERTKIRSSLSVLLVIIRIFVSKTLDFFIVKV